MLVLRPCEVEDVSTHSSSEHSVPAAVLGHGGEVERYVYVARTLGPGRRAIQQGDGDVPRELWTRPLPLEPETPPLRRSCSHGTLAAVSHAPSERVRTPSSQDVLDEWRKAFSAYTPPPPVAPAPPTRAPPSAPPSPVAVPLSTAAVSAARRVRARPWVVVAAAVVPAAASAYFLDSFGVRRPGTSGLERLAPCGAMTWRICSRWI